MEYFWYTVLKRTDDFWSITPNYYFKMQNAHIKFNSPSEDKDTKNVSYVNTSSCG